MMSERGARLGLTEDRVSSVGRHICLGGLLWWAACAWNPWDDADWDLWVTLGCLLWWMLRMAVDEGLHRLSTLGDTTQSVLESPYGRISTVQRVVRSVFRSMGAGLGLFWLATGPWGRWETGVLWDFACVQACVGLGVLGAWVFLMTLSAWGLHARRTLTRARKQTGWTRVLWEGSWTLLEGVIFLPLFCLSLCLVLDGHLMSTPTPWLVLSCVLLLGLTSAPLWLAPLLRSLSVEGTSSS